MRSRVPRDLPDRDHFALNNDFAAVGLDHIHVPRRGTGDDVRRVNPHLHLGRGGTQRRSQRDGDQNGASTFTSPASTARSVKVYPASLIGKAVNAIDSICSVMKTSWLLAIVG